MKSSSKKTNLRVHNIPLCESFTRVLCGSSLHQVVIENYMLGLSENIANLFPYEQYRNLATFAYLRRLVVIDIHPTGTQEITYISFDANIIWPQVLGIKK